MLRSFLLEYKNEILAAAEKESRQLAGVRPNSLQLERGLPVFYQQLVESLAEQKLSSPPPTRDPKAKDSAAAASGELAQAAALKHPGDLNLAKAADTVGAELLRLGYTLSHVVHTYGALCQAITGLASSKNVVVTAAEFMDLNRCLDVAIAAAVTSYQLLQDAKTQNDEVKRCGSCAHELRNALASANLALQMIRDGSVGFLGSTGQVLDRSLKRLDELIGRSLVEVKLRVGAVLHTQSTNLLLLVDQILVTANIQAKSKNQIIETEIDPNLFLDIDSQVFHSAVSNLIQNALKYSRVGGTIHIRSHLEKNDVVIEVEDECGGLSAKTAEDLFKPFEQHNEDRNGLGLGLTIARKAVALHRGTLNVTNIPASGCIFKIKVPHSSLIKTSLSSLTRVQDQSL